MEESPEIADNLLCLKKICYAGGIMKCDVIAAGIVNAAKGVSFTCSFLATALKISKQPAICCPHSDLGIPPINGRINARGPQLSDVHRWACPFPLLSD